MTLQHPIVWVADIGSIMEGNFAWCRLSIGSDDPECGAQSHTMAHRVARDLASGGRVALGFECPLWVPVPDNYRHLGSQRQGERGRPWSAGAGAAVLATGLAQSVWILERIRGECSVAVQPTFEWASLTSGKANLFLWEAFVSGEAKGASHEEDATRAAQAFIAAVPHLASDVTGVNPYSLIGAALLRCGLSTDLRLLSMSCVVVKA